MANFGRRFARPSRFFGHFSRNYETAIYCLFHALRSPWRILSHIRTYNRLLSESVGILGPFFWCNDSQGCQDMRSQEARREFALSKIGFERKSRHERGQRGTRYRRILGWTRILGGNPWGIFEPRMSHLQKTAQLLCGERFFSHFLCWGCFFVPFAFFLEIWSGCPWCFVDIGEWNSE